MDYRGSIIDRASDFGVNSIKFRQSCLKSNSGLLWKKTYVRDPEQVLFGGTPLSPNPGTSAIYVTMQVGKRGDVSLFGVYTVRSPPYARPNTYLQTNLTWPGCFGNIVEACSSTSKRYGTSFLQLLIKLPKKIICTSCLCKCLEVN